MAYMTVDFSGEIERIIREYQDEISRIEAQELFASIYSKNPPTATENYIKQRQASYDERTNALRRVLYHVLGTEEQQEQMFMSPAQQLVQRRLEELEDRINSHGGIPVDLNF